jgi:hypothetical protein
LGLWSSFNQAFGLFSVLAEPRVIQFSFEVLIALLQNISGFGLVSFGDDHGFVVAGIGLFLQFLANS